MHMPIWHTANIEISGITRNIEFSLSIPTFHCHILVPRQGSHKSCTEEGNVEPVSTNTGAWAPASSRVLAEELMSRSGCSKKSRRVQIRQKCQSSSPTMPGNQSWILQEEPCWGKKNPMAFVCNSNAMNRQITCKMLLMEMCIMDVHNQERREGIWIQALLLKFESGCIQEIKSRESMEVKDLRFCCWKGGFGKEGVVVEWLSVW